MNPTKRQTAKQKAIIIAGQLIGIILLISILMLTGCSPAEGSSDTAKSNESSDNTQDEASDDLIKVRYGVMTGNIDHHIAAVAQEQGFYKDHGLDVEVTEYAAGINTIDAIITGQLDIGFVADYAGVNRIGNTSKDTDLRFFGQFASSAQTKLYVNPETISDLSDIKGKNIISLPGTVWDYWNGLTLEKAGITEFDVTPVPVDSAQSAIAVATSGDGDCFWASGENARQLEAIGWKPIMAQEDLDAVTYQFFMASQAYLLANEDTVAAFLSATQDAIDYVLNNTDDAAEIVNAKNGLDQEVFKNILNGYTLGIGFSQEGYDDLASINS